MEDGRDDLTEQTEPTEPTEQTAPTVSLKSPASIESPASIGPVPSMRPEPSIDPDLSTGADSSIDPDPSVEDGESKTVALHLDAISLDAVSLDGVNDETVNLADVVADARASTPPAPPAGKGSKTASLPASATVWRRALAGLRHPRFTAAGTVIALLVGLLGFALIVQVKSNSSTSTLANDRPDDLVRILSDLDGRKDRLSTEISALQAQQRQLSSGAQGRDAALAAAAQRADELGILAGTLPAQGPGLTISIAPADTPIAASLVLDAVEALRGSGAEAMQISGVTGGPIRIVASTSFVDASGGVLADGQLLTGTFTITVIGDPQTMQTALTIPGEVDDMVKQAGGNVIVDQPGTVEVTALHASAPAKYAHPVS